MTHEVLRYLLTVLLVASAAGTCSAFITPMTGRSSSIRLHQSSDDDNSSTVNIALIQSDNDDELFSMEGFDNALQSHPFCRMTGVILSVSTISVATDFTKEDFSSLQNADIACFSTIKGVKSYLSMLDDHFDLAEDITDEDRRTLPNKPEGAFGADNEDMNEAAVPDPEILQEVGGSRPDVGIMAACPNTNTAKECLNSGRWKAEHIYYPKDRQKAVELKTEAIDSDSDKTDEEEEEDIDVEVWAASIVQAAGDVYERQFWGGGW